MNPSKLIDQQIAELTDWRGKTLAKLRHPTRSQRLRDYLDEG